MAESNTSATHNEDEFLLIGDKKRYTTKPILHPDIWEMYKLQEKSIWRASEIKLADDYAIWNSLDNNSRKFIKYVLAFFAASDVPVSDNISQRFINDVNVLECKYFYDLQKMMENVHSETYSLLLEGYVPDVKEREFLLNSIDNIPCISRKIKWIEKWLSSDERFAVRLFAFAIIEGVFFSGSFCAIYWLNQDRPLPGLGHANDFIARDEGLHTEFASLLYVKYIKNKLTNEEIHKIINEAVEIETEFITEALPCSLIGMKAESMITYIKHVANRLLLQLGHAPIYENVNQPFAFMDRIALKNKNNFFELEVSEYQKHSELDEDAFTDI
jgi:ribonucleoside-diphosphate reductase beta chain